MPTERTPDPASEASRLLTEQDAGVVRAWLSGEKPGPGHAALDRLRAALVARDAELARLTARLGAAKRDAAALSGQHYLQRAEAADARAEALEAEVTQLRAALEEEQAWDMGGVPENEWKRLAHDRGEALKQIVYQLGHVEDAGFALAIAREALAGVVPPEQET